MTLQSKLFSPFCPGSNPYPSHGHSPVPTPNYGAYPQSGKPPQQGSNYFNSALNAIGNATGQNARIQSLAQCECSVTTSLF